MPTYIELLYSVCLRISYKKVVKFDPRGWCASRKFLIIGKKIETLKRGGDLDENSLLSWVSWEELSVCQKESPCLSSGAGRTGARCWPIKRKSRRFTRNCWCSAATFRIVEIRFSKRFVNCTSCSPRSYFRHVVSAIICTQFSLTCELILQLY